MLNIMYSAPEDKTIQKIVVTPSVITESAKPIIIRKQETVEDVKVVNE